MHPYTYHKLTTELTTELKLFSWCDLVRTVSHDRGLSYSNRLCDSAEFVHVTPTMELFLRPTPRNLSHRILGTRPRRSELESSNKIILPRVPLTASPTPRLG